MYRADDHGYLIEIVITNPNANEKALAKRQHCELVAKLGKKKLASLQPEMREALVRRRAGMFSMNAAAKEQPLQWDWKRLLFPVISNTAILDDVRRSKYPTTLPHYERVI